MNARILWVIGADVVGTMTAQCARQQQSPADGTAEGSAAAGKGEGAKNRDARHAGESDSSRVARLEREARAMANASGCASTDQCRAAPVGERPCGGPRTYIVYCARTTDSAA